MPVDIGAIDPDSRMFINARRGINFTDYLNSTAV